MTFKLPRHALTGLLVGALALASAGCLSAPDNIQEEFSAPDGRRPNNFRRGHPRGRPDPVEPPSRSVDKKASAKTPSKATKDAAAESPDRPADPKKG